MNSVFSVVVAVFSVWKVCCSSTVVSVVFFYCLLVAVGDSF